MSGSATHHGEHWIVQPDKSLKANSPLVWDSVSLDYAGRVVLSNVDVFLGATEFTCLCGSNGAGKTQLSRLGIGLLKPTSGFVRLLGVDPNASRKQVGYVPQSKVFNRAFPASVCQLLVAAIAGYWPFVVTKRMRDLAAEKLDSVGGLHLLSKDLTVLSGGELQRVFLARALVNDPKVLVLDEPLAAVDTRGRGELMSIFANLRDAKKLSVLMITHSELVVKELSDRVILLHKGRLLAWGNRNHFLENHALRHAAFMGHDHSHAVDIIDEVEA